MRRRTASHAVALCALLAVGSAAAEEAVELDEEFLEFLANLDSDDEAWGDFLDAAGTGDEVDGKADDKAKAPPPAKDEKVKGEEKVKGDDQP